MTTLPDQAFVSTLTPSPLALCADVRKGAESACLLYLPRDTNALVIAASRATVEKITGAVLAATERPLTDAPVPYRVEPIGAGLGVVAARDIRAGELILRERPLLVTAHEAVTDPRRYGRGHLYGAAISQLSEPSKTKLLALANSCGPETEQIEGIVKTNAIVVGLVPEVGVPDGRALFNDLMRANHACAPSAHYYFDISSFTGKLHATRDLAKGEEITISYTSITDPRAKRRAALAATYNFECTCRTCSLPPAQSAESDRRRIAIDAFATSLEREEPRGPIEAIVPQVEEALEWIQLEGIPAEAGRLLGLAVTMAMTAEAPNWALLFDWGARAKASIDLLHGADSSFSQMFDQLLALRDQMQARG